MLNVKLLFLNLLKLLKDKVINIVICKFYDCHIGDICINACLPNSLEVADFVPIQLGETNHCQPFICFYRFTFLSTKLRRELVTLVESGEMDHWHLVTLDQQHGSSSSALRK